MMMTMMDASELHLPSSVRNEQVTQAAFSLKPKSEAAFYLAPGEQVLYLLPLWQVSPVGLISLVRRPESLFDCESKPGVAGSHNNLCLTHAFCKLKAIF